MSIKLFVLFRSLSTKRPNEVFRFLVPAPFQTLRSKNGFTFCHLPTFSEQKRNSYRLVVFCKDSPTGGLEFSNRDKFCTLTEKINLLLLKMWS